MMELIHHGVVLQVTIMRDLQHCQEISPLVAMQIIQHDLTRQTTYHLLIIHPVTDTSLRHCQDHVIQAAVITLGVADTNGEMDKLHLKAFDIFYCRNLLYLCKTAN